MTSSDGLLLRTALVSAAFSIRKLAGEGMSKRKIARTLGIGVSVAQRVLVA
jgi:transposase